MRGEHTLVSAHDHGYDGTSQRACSRWALRFLLHLELDQIVVLLLSNPDGLSRPVLGYEGAFEHNNNMVEH